MSGAYRVLSVFDEDNKDKYDSFKRLIQSRIALRIIENDGKGNKDNISFNVNIPIMMIFTGSLVENNTKKIPTFP